MSELVTTSVIAGITTPVFERVFKGGEAIIDRFKARRRRELVKEQFSQGLPEYREYFQRRHGRVKFIGKSEPVDVNKVFTPIDCIDSEVYFQINDSLQTLEMQFLSERRVNKNQNSRRKPVVEIAKETQHLMLLGGPGVGKTTFLRKIGMESLNPSKKQEYGHNHIPVFIELKRFVSEQTTIEQLIQQEFDVFGMPNSLELTRYALEAGTLLILLDGLDEIPYSNLNYALRQIKDFVDRYHNNRYITSCREGANYHRLLSSFTTVQITDFSDSQIKSFVNIWFQVESDIEDDKQERELSLERGKSFLRTLQKERNFAVRELARNPLLLTLLCLVYQGSNNLPSNRVSLFQQALELFTNKWFAIKKVQPNPILYQEFDPILERAMLSEVAYRGFTLNRVFFSERELIGYIRAYMRKNLNAPDLDSQEVLSTIKIYQGILIDQVQNYSSFSHVTFQEYLTAQYIYDNHRIKELVDEHMFNRRWKEVFSMVSGLLICGSDKLLYQMVRKSRQSINSERVRGLIAWSEATVSENMQALKNKLPLSADHLKGKHLEYRSWDLIIKHAATFYVLGTLLCSYTKALKGCGENDVETISHNMDLSNILTKYSSALISEVHEYLSSKSVKSTQKEEFEHFVNLIGSIKYIGSLSKSVIRLEHRERNLSRLRKLRKQFYKTGIFYDLNTTPIRENLALLEKKENLGRKCSVRESKSLVRRMWRNWLLGLRLAPVDITDMSAEEMKSLEQYLYTNLLIVNCRIRAVKISHKSWNKTLLGMVQRAT